MSVLIIGQNPGNNPKAAVYKGHTFVRLNEWCDELSINRYSFANVVTTPGKVKMKDVDFDRLKNLVACHEKVLALGVFASNSLSVINKSHFRLPHPSPLNRQINDKEFIRAVLAECKKYLI